MSDLAILYGRAFRHLEQARSLKMTDPPAALQCYRRGCRDLAELIRTEPSLQKVGLIRSELDNFQKEMVKLENECPPQQARIVQQATPPSAAEARMRFEEGITFDQHNDLGPAVERYMAAVAIYLACLQVQDDSAIRRRIAQILDRIAELRLMTAQLTALDIPEAPQAPLPLPIAPAANPRAAQLPPDGGVEEMPFLASTRSTDLSTTEIDVIRESSTINGKLFYPWIEGEDSRERFRYPRRWSDPDGPLALSRQQAQHVTGWKRPSDFLPEGQSPVMIRDVNPFTITQELVTDCSFVASLCIAAAFEQRFNRQLITRIIYPQQNRRPVYNPDGKYLVKLWVNGVARKVLVDDLLPVDANNRLLCSASARGGELWVSIIEKAYLKVHGGYDFPGSNSGIDLFALTGWIPEQIFFSEDASTPQRGIATATRRLDFRQPEERVWERLCSAHSYGDCLITISTSTTMTQEEVDAVGLVIGHAYALLDARQVGPLRMVKLKNPWARRRWRGRFSADDTASWTPELMRELRYDADRARMADNGIFWIEFADVRRFYRSFNFNWNPELFDYRAVLHDRWLQDEGPRNDQYFLGQNPQYTLLVDRAVPTNARTAAPMTSSTSPTVWVLVTRHVTRTESDEEGAFLAVLTYKGTDGKRVYGHPEPYISDIYSNDPHHLVRFDVDFDEQLQTSDGQAIPSDTASFTIVLSQVNRSANVNYTINVYSTSAFRFYKAPLPPPYRTEAIGAWGEGRPGGEPAHGTYHTNPMWRLRVLRATPVHIEALAPREVFANITVIGGDEGGRRVLAPHMRNVVASSGSYREGFTYLECNLAPGIYTLVVSRYTPGESGRVKVLTYGDVSSYQIENIEP